jgi:hypothetical protein
LFGAIVAKAFILIQARFNVMWSLLRDWLVKVSFANLCEERNSNQSGLLLSYSRVVVDVVSNHL